MNLYELFYRSKEGEASEPEGLPKAEGFALLWRAISQNPWNILKLNLAFLVGSIAIVTIPAAFTALLGMNFQFLLGKNIDFVPEFWKLFKDSFARATPIGLLSMIMIFAIGFGIYFYASIAENVAFFAVIAVIFLLILLCFIIMSFYIYPMLAFTDLKMIQVIKNALYLTIICLPRNILTLLAMGALLFISIFSFHVSMIIYAVAGFSLLGLIIAFCVHKGLMKHVFNN